MGCAPSSPQDVDLLPIKAQCRTAFSRSSTTDRPNGTLHAADKQQGQQPEGEGEAHDVVLCYPLGGTVFGLELQARYEKLDGVSVSVWTPDHYLSPPGSPNPAGKTASGRPQQDPRGRAGGQEIRPAPEASGGAGDAGAPSQQLCREVRTCRRGVVVLLTAGCTWDDGVLSCLRLAARFLRPLVLVHCCDSCPLPDLAEWPPDVRQLIAAAGAPVKYLSQHAAEALHDVERRMLAAAAAAAAAGAEQQQQQQPLQAEQRQEPKQQQPAGLRGLFGGGAAARTQQAAGAVEAAEAAAEADRPLSLAALREADPALAARAAQLLGHWAAAGRACGSAEPGPVAAVAATAEAAAAARPGSCCTPSRAPSTTTTPVEALPSSWLSSPHKPATPPGASARSWRHGPLPPPSPPPGQGQQQWPSGSEWGEQPRLFHAASHARRSGAGYSAQAEGEWTSADAGAGSSGAAAAAPCRCVLRYRDTVWATPVAFLCAQLEAELGRSSVCVQAAPAAPPPSSTAVGHREAYPGSVAAVAYVGSAAAAAAAAVTAAAAPLATASAASSVCGGRPDTTSPSASAASRGDGGDGCGSADDLVLFKAPSTEECFLTASELASPKAPPGPGCGLAAAPAGAGGAAPPQAAQSRAADGWDLDPGEASPSGPAAAAAGDATCVYFITPGPTTPAACLAELVSALAAGRRVVLVADGEACQRLAGQAPHGVSTEAWAAVRRLWAERLLYVQDYHAPFAALLLRQALAGPPAGS